MNCAHALSRRPQLLFPKPAPAIEWVGLYFQKLDGEFPPIHVPLQPASRKPYTCFLLPGDCEPFPTEQAARMCLANAHGLYQVTVTPIRKLSPIWHILFSWWLHAHHGRIPAARVPDMGDWWDRRWHGRVARRIPRRAIMSYPPFSDCYLTWPSLSLWRDEGQAKTHRHWGECLLRLETVPIDIPTTDPGFESIVCNAIEAAIKAAA